MPSHASLPAWDTALVAGLQLAAWVQQCYSILGVLTLWLPSAVLPSPMPLGLVNLMTCLLSLHQVIDSDAPNSQG